MERGIAFWASQPHRVALAGALVSSIRLRSQRCSLPQLLSELGSLARALPLRREPDQLLIRAIGGWARRLLPQHRCLTEALAVRWAYQRAGLEPTLCIGVRYSDAGQFQAHAWLTHQGSIVCGGSPEKIATYSPLPLQEAANLF